ncbi:DUF4249 domain-containing protein [Flavobacterium amniphilum]|uniref:DUF4249 domain-containing protein n=1 Tax=Flavobacterium amniphilum TaxID=1834035 RepID=UPI00202A3C05|nr:DUF4249 domain-containing protein [Flavobacterium amniphilum]MCL9804707.1 DUF4249 domain-containing protein [Flavobacterium amniphilum]
MARIFYLFILGILFLQSCTEPYALQTEDFENVIVIEATLTDEYKYQEVKLTRSYKMEYNIPEVEAGAVVFVTDSNGNQFNFSEVDDKYVSQQEFKALPNVTYQLHVTTAEGKSYTSTHEKIASVTDIDAIIARRGNSGTEGDGAQIIVNSTKTTDNTEYYRFTYEETNKIIAPKWIPYRGVAVYYNPPPATSPDLGYMYMEPWPYEAKTCYSTEKSKDILISNTSLNSSNASANLVRFLKVGDYKIANRYSIEVSLYNQSQAANKYYDAMKKASSAGGLLSQTQNGFYNGNIRNQANPTEKVVGFFDVSHISKKRIFFNFEDLFQNHQKPDYPYYCPESDDPNAAELSYMVKFCFPNTPSTDCDGPYVLAAVSGKLKSVFEYTPSYQIGIPVTAVSLRNIQCGDCTSFSSNIKPEFWID